MSIRCGFFNSINNDRKYDAEDMGRLFEGVISDGIFSTVEPKFEVEPVPETMDLLVNNGKAWFHERYFEIYGPETVSIRQTDVNPRIDAICICINTTDSVRAGSIEVIEGSTSKPSIPAEDGVYYIPIAWVTVGPNDTVSTDLDIESNVGNAHDPVEAYRCPYSEPTLDPRRAVYAYEGESGVDPSINKMVVLSATMSDPEYHPDNDQFEFSYPEGFTWDNTLVMSFMLRYAPRNHRGYIWRTHSNSTVFTDEVTPTKIIADIGDQDGGYLTACRIVIMKIEEESQNE